MDCPLLSLPVEIRIQIYTYIYQSADQKKCSPIFTLRDDTTILQPLARWFKHPGPGLLRTCRQIHTEAAPIMYENANFRFNVYVGDGWPKYQYAGPVDASNPLLRQLRHVDFTVHLNNEAHVDPAFRRLQLFAQALEEAEADVRSIMVTFKAVTSYLMAVTGDLVAGRRDQVLAELGQDECQLYRKMLIESKIISIR